ncbi:DUF4998 domain-containing protein [uncultured Polaribacter sp.]|uniref:DUF4998 domain-containing protein n=1 Tax=uncultured Polaribacter sp. TaxID=174711 RepID=UPI0026016406|nr:DUF4998 domain-containing protein [uncultured Polaribacter sp.]
MINKIKKIISHIFLFSILLIGINACDALDEDAYKVYTDGGEIQYRGKFDSVQIFPGRNRVQLSAIVNSDPRVTSYRVYWGNRSDSAVFPIQKSQIATKISQIIENLDENTYNFEVLTFDDQGNSSIPVFSIGKVFGSNYEAILLNRSLVKQAYQPADNSAVVQFAPIDTTSGIIDSELEYTDNQNVTKTFKISADSLDDLILENFDLGNTFKYRSSYVPDPTSIDTFYTAYNVIKPDEPITIAPYFVNASAPFTILERENSNRYATPSDWILNDGALNHNGFGVVDTQRSDEFNLVSGFGGEPDIVNGKIHQRMRLEPGTYTYTVSARANNFVSENDKVYFLAALGSELPDVDNVEASTNTLAFKRVTTSAAQTYETEFTLTEDFTNISIGIAVANDPGQNRFMQITSFALKKK